MEFCFDIIDVAECFIQSHLRETSVAPQLDLLPMNAIEYKVVEREAVVEAFVIYVLGNHRLEIILFEESMGVLHKVWSDGKRAC